MSQATREPRGVKGGIPPYREPTPETYRTYRYPSEPEKPYLTTEKPPSKADVTLVKPEPSVRQQILQQRYAAETTRITGLRQRIGEAKERLYGVHEQLYETQTTLFQLRPSLYYKELEKQTEFRGLEKFALEEKPKAIYLHQVMGYGFEEMAEQPQWFAGEVQAHYPMAEAVTLEDLITMASLVSISYGYARLAKQIVAPTLAAAWKGSRVETWLLRQSDWYAKRAAKGLAPQIVATQQVSGDVPLSFGKMKAAEVAWELAYTPKSSLVTIGVAPEVVAKTKILPHAFFRHGLFSTGYLRQLSFAEPTYGGLFSEKAFATETVTREAERVLPYFPSVEALPRAVPRLFPFLVPPLFKISAEAVAKPKAEARERTVAIPLVRPKVQPVVRPVMRDVSMVSPYMKPDALTSVVTRQISKTVAMQKPMLKQRQIVSTKQVAVQTMGYGWWFTQATKPPMVAEPFRKPKKRGRARVKKGFEWRFRLHGVAEPEQLLRSLVDMVKTK